MGGIVQPTQLPGADMNREEAQHEIAPFLMNHPNAGLVLTLHSNGCTVGRVAPVAGNQPKVTLLCVKASGGEETGLALMAYMSPAHARSTARSLMQMADDVEEQGG